MLWVDVAHLWRDAQHSSHPQPTARADAKEPGQQGLEIRRAAEAGDHQDDEQLQLSEQAVSRVDTSSAEAVQAEAPKVV